MLLILTLILLSSVGDAIHLPRGSTTEPGTQPGVTQPEAKPGVVQPDAKPDNQPEAKPGVAPPEGQVKAAVVQTQEQQIAAQQAIQRTVEYSSSTMYAFSAFITSDLLISEGATIIFDSVVTNVGGLYYNTSGQFFCPDDGIYVFLWTIIKTSNTLEDMQCITALTQGGADRKYGPKTSYFSTTFSGTTSMTSALQCTLGTAVTIVVKPWSDTTPTSNFHNKHTTFSGFKLPSSIAFTVELSKDIYVFDGGRIMFDDVLYDFGGHFDVILGGFRCPDDGIYVFSVSAHTTDPTTPWSVSRLMKDGEVVVLGPITYRATATLDSGSNSIMVVVQCEEGKSIYVETQAAHDFPHNSYAPQLTSFTGFKLFNSSDSTAVAFTAILANNHTATVDGLPLPMEQVIINVGDAYNSNFNAFVCPDDAFYVFSWSATGNFPGTSSHIDLYNDDTVVNNIFQTRQSIDDATGTSGTASISIIVQCTPSSRFQLRVRRAATEYVYLAGYTHFSGYKVPGTY